MLNMELERFKPAYYEKLEVSVQTESLTWFSEWMKRQEPKGKSLCFSATKM